MTLRAKSEGKSTRYCLSEFFDLFGGTPFDIIDTTSWGEMPGPALCSHKCTIGMNETCPHGCPSVLLTLIQYSYDWDDIVEFGDAPRQGI